MASRVHTNTRSVKLFLGMALKMKAYTFAFVCLKIIPFGCLSYIHNIKMRIWNIGIFDKF